MNLFKDVFPLFAKNYSTDRLDSFNRCWGQLFIQKEVHVTAKGSANVSVYLLYFALTKQHPLDILDWELFEIDFPQNVSQIIFNFTHLCIVLGHFNLVTETFCFSLCPYTIAWISILTKSEILSPVWISILRIHN